MTGLIVHEWLARSGGSEKVVDQMLEAFPGSDLRVLWDDSHAPRPAVAQESWLARTPLRHHKALALPFMLPTWRRMTSARRYEWMLTSSHLFAHHARLTGENADVPKLAYVHTPARYVWAPEQDPRGASAPVRAVAPMLKALDRRRAQELVAVAANSAFIAHRIATTWEREAVVIHPPVDVSRILSQSDWSAELGLREAAELMALPQDFLLGVSRFIPYKRLDLVIEVGERVGMPVVIAGRGPEEAALRAQAASARVPVHFVVSPSDELLYALYQRADVLVFPAVEDFGIVPVEAQAAGTPVVTGPTGGQTEALTPRVSGIVAESTDIDDLAHAVRAARELPAFDPQAVTNRFSNAEFAHAIRDFVSTTTGAALPAHDRVRQNRESELHFS